MNQFTAGAAISMISTGGGLVAAGAIDGGWLIAVGIATGVVSVCVGRTA